ncbi:MAG TPA: AtpZ/AtpI family protein [Croceibacterium sp.]
MANTPDSTLQEDPAIDSLDARIAAARAAEEARLSQQVVPVGDHVAPATQVISTMVGYPLGGIIIGFGLDRLFNTLPWITIGLMFLAFIGGCLHAIRLAKHRAN